jgi:hypothetical protein
MRITLEISGGPETGRKAWLTAGQSLVIGRTQLADFSLPGDPQMSSTHFQIAWQGNSFLVRDLKSTNGTSLNGVRVQEAQLQSGDVIAAGSSQFTVLLESVSPKSDEQKPSPQGVPGTVAGLAEITKTVGARPAAELPLRPGVSPPIEADDVPQPLVVTNRTPFPLVWLPWQNAEGAGRLTVIVKATFRFADSAVHIAERQLPIWFGDQHEGDDPLQPVRFESDTAPFKPRADVVLVGTAYSPGGRPRPLVDVRLRVGTLNRRLRVFGDRRWLFPTRLAVVPQITDPEPFADMPLTYRRSFGGIDQPAARYCAENLAGVGFIGEPAPASIHDKPLPNIEDPEHLIASWDSRPQPAGFGFYGRGWLPRLKFLGTYDESHRRIRSPLPPDDFSYACHNGAHPDLQIAGFLEGDELVELENLTRDGYARFALPGIRLRITLTRFTSTTHPDRPIRPVLDTLVFVPDEQTFYMLFRAVFAVPAIERLGIAEIRVETER